MLASAFDLIANFSFTGWLVIVLGFVVVVFAGLIFLQDLKKRSNRSFFFLAAVIFSWNVMLAFFDATISASFASQTLVYLYLIAALIPLMLYRFLSVFFSEEDSAPLRKKVLVAMPFLVIAGILLLVPDLIVSYRAAASDMSGGEIVFGKAYSLYAIYILTFIAASYILLIKKYRISVGIFRSEVRDILINISMMLVAILFLVLVPPFFADGMSRLWVGHIVISFGVLCMCLTIIKYNSLSFKVIITQFFVTIIVIILLAELFNAESILELALETGITIFVIFSSFFLTGSIRREIESKQKITQLLHELDHIHVRLKVLDKKKSEFLAIASHHLRDPLTAIKGYASMLLESSFGELSLGVREALGKIYESSNHLITMISDFMDISNIESGDMKYNFVDVDLKELVTKVVADMKQYSDRARLTLTYTIDEANGFDYITVADTVKIRQVFSNIIDNSIKYTPKGEVSILLSKSADGKKLIFSTSDTGIGMTENTKEKIFRKFSRAEGINKVYTEGTGLGLYVAKEIIEKHKGRIWAESKGEGLGSQFYVELDAKE